MRQNLESIARHQGQGYDELYQQLKTIHLSVMQLETKQFQLKQQLQPMLTEIKSMYRDFHASACNGLSQIRSHFVNGQSIPGRHYIPTIIDETLPDRFFFTSVEQVEHRMHQCVQQVQYFEQQLAARISVVEGSRRLLNSHSPSSSSAAYSYGQAQRVTPAMLLTIIKQQAHNFVLLSAQVNAVHQSVHDLKQAYLAHRRQVHKDSTNPFETADRREAAERKQNEEKIRLEQQIQAQQSGEQSASSYSMRRAGRFFLAESSGSFFFLRQKKCSVSPVAMVQLVCAMSSHPRRRQSKKLAELQLGSYRGYSYGDSLLTLANRQRSTAYAEVSGGDGGYVERIRRALARSGSTKATQTGRSGRTERRSRWTSSAEADVGLREVQRRRGGGRRTECGRRRFCGSERQCTGIAAKSVGRWRCSTSRRRSAEGIRLSCRCTEGAQLRCWGAER